VLGRSPGLSWFNLRRHLDKWIISLIDEAQRLFAATRKLSYRVFYFTLYSLGLRLGEGLALKVSDIDAQRRRVHIRDAKGDSARAE
jgi:integrase/recombinase XerD